MTAAESVLAVQDFAKASQMSNILGHAPLTQGAAPRATSGKVHWQLPDAATNQESGADARWCGHADRANPAASTRHGLLCFAGIAKFQGE